MRLRLLLLSILAIGFGSMDAWSAPDQTMSISPSATAGTTITASDENSRNSSISTPYNAHSHNDISSTTANTFNLGDGNAGNKTLCANAADATDVCLRFDDTVDRWVMNTGDVTTYSMIVWESGTSGIPAGRLLQGGGDGAITAFNSTAPADDQIVVADSSTAGTPRTVPNCTDASGNHLNYTQSSNTFSCGTSRSSVESNLVSFTRTDAQGSGSVTIAHGLSAAPTSFLANCADDGTEQVSWGYADDDADEMVADRESAASTHDTNTGAVVRIINGANSMTLVVDSYDATNINATWTEAGSGQDVECVGLAFR